MVEQIRKNTRFIDVLQHFLNRGLQGFLSADGTMTREDFEGMYEYILQTVNELFAKSSQNLTEDTKRWVAQQLYLSIRMKEQGALELPGGENLIAPPPVFEKTPIARVPTDELRIIGGLLSDCDFAHDILAELRSRSWSR